MKMPKVKLTCRYRAVCCIVSIIIGAILFLSIFSYFKTNGLWWNIFLETEFMIGIAAILITFLFGIFTFLGSKVMASVQVELNTFDEKRPKHNILKVVDVPISIVNKHGMPVRIITKVFFECIKNNQKKEITSINKMYRGEEKYFLLGGCSHSSHVEFKKEDFKEFDYEIPDGTKLIVEAFYENQYTYIEECAYQWEWSKSRNLWIFYIPREE
jgi:hypothetical protein